MTSKPYRASLLLLCALFVIVVYRAKTQSLTIDEARTFTLYVDKPLEEMTRFYDACNHVLHTLLMKLFRARLGYSELVLRLPSLLGCLLYFGAVLRSARLLFGERWMQTLAVAVLTLNPLILDFMVAARGYGLALGLFWWVLYFVLRIVLQEADTGLLWRAGVTAGLSIAANLTILVPVSALGVVLAIVALRRGFWRNLDQFIGPAVVVAFLPLVLPLLRVERENFYVGVQTWREAVATLIGSSLAYSPARTLFLSENFRSVLSDTGIPILFFGLVLGGAVALLFTLRGSSRPAGFAVLASLLALCVTGLTILHQAAGVLYPYSRTGLYLLPIFTMTMVLALDAVRTPLLTYGITTLLAAAYLIQIDVRYFNEWKFDASTKELISRIASDHAARKGTERVRVAVSYVLESSMSYYRQRKRLRWMEPVQQHSFEDKPYDYYVLLGDDFWVVQKLGLRIVYTDALSGSVLAVKS